MVVVPVQVVHVLILPFLDVVHLLPVEENTTHLPVAGGERRPRSGEAAHLAVVVAELHVAPVTVGAGGVVSLIKKEQRCAIRSLNWVTEIVDQGRGDGNAAKKGEKGRSSGLMAQCGGSTSDKDMGFGCMERREGYHHATFFP